MSLDGTLCPNVSVLHGHKWMGLFASLWADAIESTIQRVCRDFSRAISHFPSRAVCRFSLGTIFSGGGRNPIPSSADRALCRCAKRMSVMPVVPRLATEAITPFMVHERVFRTLTLLRNKGFSVGLDDFGTGFTALTHLLTYPVDVIKPDRSFIERVTVDSRSAMIVASMIDIASDLNMKVIAEGIETDSQFKQLARFGCRFGQGYRFGKPRSLADTTALLQSNTAAICDPNTFEIHL